MRFRLLDKSGKDKVHEGVMSRLKAPDVVSWGHRAFVRSGEQSGVVSFKEVETFRI